MNFHNLDKILFQETYTLKDVLENLMKLVFSQKKGIWSCS